MKKKIFLLVLVNALLLINASAEGSRFRSDGQVRVAAGDTVRTDFFVGAKSVDINGVVQGDLFAFCQRLRVGGSVAENLHAFAQSVEVLGKTHGDVNGFAEEVRVDGVVEDDVRAFANRLIINGRVKGNVRAGCGEVAIGQNGVVEGDLKVDTGELMIEGTVQGSVKGKVGRATLAGVVGRNVELRIDDGFQVPATAKISGDLKYVSRKPIDIQGAVAGQVIFEEARPRVKVRRAWTPLRIGFKIWSAVAALVVGLVLVALSKRTTQTITAMLHQEPLKGLAWGFLLLIAGPVAVVISVLLVVTIPLGMISLGLYFILLYLSRILTGLFVGREILQRLTGREPSPYAAVVAGVILVWVLINAPHVGWFFHLVAMLLGLGGILLALPKVVRPPMGPAAAVSP